MLENFSDSTKKYLSAKAGFGLHAANDDSTRVFTKNELIAIHKIIEPLSGSAYTSPVTFNGIDYYGENLDIYIPVAGRQAGNHVLSIHKAPAGAGDLSYAISLVEKGDVLPCNRFHNVLNVMTSMLNSQAVQSYRPQNHL